MSTRGRALRDRFNWVSVAAILMLIAISLLAQRNADFYQGGDFYDAQIIWVLIGGMFFFVPAVVVDLRLVDRVAYPLWGLTVTLLILTSLFGTEVNNSRRWLRWGINIQASELAKLSIILALARLYHGRRERIPGEEPPEEGPYGLKGLLIPAVIVLLPAAFIVTQPDLGTTLLILLVAVVMTFYEGVRTRTVVIGVLAATVLIPVAWKTDLIRDYQKDRVRLLVNPELTKFDPDTAAKVSAGHNQSEQAVWAISSGKFWGQGSQAGSQQRLKYMPEMHTDMIVSVYAEEHGFVGCTLLLLLFWLLVVWGLRTAKDSRDRFCELVAVGVASMIGLQVFINIGMVAGLLPIVGLPLPFLSYGGSATVTMLASLGLVLNIALRRGRL